MIGRARKFRFLGALAVISVGTLAGVELAIPKEGWSGVVHYLLHHVAALVGGASIVGMLFELWVRREMVDEVKRAFLENPDFSRLFADEEREIWVRNILSAQMPSDPSLSDAVFADVVRPLMTRRRFRSELDYFIQFDPRPSEGWRLDSLKAHSDEYVWLRVTYSFKQHLPRGLPEANISVIVQNAFEELHAAFDDEACLYRDYLVLHSTDSEAVKNQLESMFGLQSRGSSVDIRAELSIDGKSCAPTRTEFDKAKGRLRFWFDLPSREELDLQVRLSAPYLVTAGHYPVIYGEPTASSRVTFRPGPCAPVTDVNVIHLLQGTRQQPPDVSRDSDSVHVGFPHSGGYARWILPKSGIVFLWHHRAASPRPIRPPVN